MYRALKKYSRQLQKLTKSKQQLICRVNVKRIGLVPEIIRYKTVVQLSEIEQLVVIAICPFRPRREAVFLVRVWVHRCEETDVVAHDRGGRHAWKEAESVENVGNVECA